MNYSDFRTEVFAKIIAFVEDRDCNSYEIMGYKYGAQRLILNYRDCVEVVEFELIKDDIVQTRFFTTDFTDEEYFANIKSFDERMSFHKPEIK